MAGRAGSNRIARAAPLVAIACGAVALPSLAWARGIEVGVRAGYAIPYGRASERESLNGSVSGSFPLLLDAGFRFGDRVYAGLLGQVAIGLPRGCEPGTPCAVEDYRLAFNGQIHLRKNAPRVDPWVGVGFGYEWLHRRRVTGGSHENLTLSGIEFLIAQAGCDFRVAPRVAIGAFVSFNIAQYASRDGSTDGKSLSGDVLDPAVHGWATFGLRAVFDLWIMPPLADPNAIP